MIAVGRTTAPKSPANTGFVERKQRSRLRRAELQPGQRNATAPGAVSRRASRRCSPAVRAPDAGRPPVLVRRDEQSVGRALAGELGRKHAPKHDLAAAEPHRHRVLGQAEARDRSPRAANRGRSGARARHACRAAGSASARSSNSTSSVRSRSTSTSTARAADASTRAAASSPASRPRRRAQRRQTLRAIAASQRSAPRGIVQLVRVPPRLEQRLLREILRGVAVARDRRAQAHEPAALAEARPTVACRSRLPSPHLSPPPHENQRRFPSSSLRASPTGSTCCSSSASPGRRSP